MSSHYGGVPTRNQLLRQFAERARVAAAADPGRRTGPLSLEEDDQPAAPSKGGFATPVSARPGVAGAPMSGWGLGQGVGSGSAFRLRLAFTLEEGRGRRTAAWSSGAACGRHQTALWDT